MIYGQNQEFPFFIIQNKNDPIIPDYISKKAMESSFKGFAELYGLSDEVILYLINNFPGNLFIQFF